tara:strand:- start:91 stop:246 length:156 start_codon:yes stop_codon:yes gene_type:complete
MAKKAKATKKAEPKPEVKKEEKKVEKKEIPKCEGHSGPPCADPDCLEWGRW